MNKLAETQLDITVQACAKDLHERGSHRWEHIKKLFLSTEGQKLFLDLNKHLNRLVAMAQMLFLLKCLLFTQHAFHASYLKYLKS